MFKDIKQVMKDSVLYGIGNVAVKLVGFILIPLYTDAEYFSTADYGLMGLLEVTSQILIAVMGLSLYSGLIRWYWDAEYRDKQKTIFFTTLLFTILTSLCIGSVLWLNVGELSALLVQQEGYSLGGELPYILQLLILTSMLGAVVEVPQNLLKNMIKGTSFAIAQDEARPILQGILFEVKDKQLNLVALDGYRLAIRNELLDIDNDIEVVIPGKTLNEVSKILEDNSDLVEITFTNNHILFNLKTTKVISRLLEGKFVNYNSLLPQEHKLIVNVKKQELQNGIERASLMAKDGNSNLIKLDVQEDILIITSNSQLGKVREEVAINLQGEEVQIAFNSRYLLDVLKNMEEEEIVMEMTSGITPCVIKGKNMNNSKYLVLPVRLVR